MSDPPLGSRDNDPPAVRAVPGQSVRPSPVSPKVASRATFSSNVEVLTEPFEPVFDPTHQHLGKNRQPIPGSVPGAIIIKSPARTPSITSLMNVGVKGDGCFVFGVIQNLREHDVHFEYGESDSPPFPKVFRLKTIPPLPLRDHAGPQTDTASKHAGEWYSFDVIGRCSFFDIIDMPPKKEVIGSSGTVLAADRPGSAFPAFIMHQGKKLSMRRAKMLNSFITWYAIRGIRAKPDKLSSYHFFQHAAWKVDREWKIGWAGSVPTFTSTRKADSLERGGGMGGTAPVLVGPDAGSPGSYHADFE